MIRKLSHGQRGPGDRIANLPSILGILHHKGPDGFLQVIKDNHQSNDNQPSEDFQLLSHFMLLPLAGDDDTNGRDDDADLLHRVHERIVVFPIVHTPKKRDESISGREGRGEVHWRI